MRRTLEICYLWMFPCVPNVKVKWNSTREPAEYRGPLPLVCFTSAWLSWSNPALCQYGGWELRHQTRGPEPEPGRKERALVPEQQLLHGREVARAAWDTATWAWEAWLGPQSLGCESNGFHSLKADACLYCWALRFNHPSFQHSRRNMLDSGCFARQRHQHKF